MPLGNIDIVLEILLVGLLAITLVHAVRLERALKVLRQDRATLGDAIAGFDSSSREAEAGIFRLQNTASEAAHLLGQRVEQALALKDDLQFLAARGEAAADRLDGLVRTARATSAPPSPVPSVAAAPASASSPEAMPKVRSQAERDLLLALRGAQ